MSCEYSRDLHAWHDGELSDSAQRRIEAHVAECEQCRQELRELQSLSRVLAAMQRPTMPQDAKQRLGDSLLIGQRSLLRMAELLSAAAALILAVGLAFLVQGRPAPNRTSTAVEVTAIDYSLPDEMSPLDGGAPESIELAQWLEGLPATGQP